MTQHLSRSLAKVLAFVVVTVGLTVWIATTIVGVDRGPHYGLRATFDDVAGLRAGDDVKLAGVAVGSVTGVAVEQGKALVSFEIDEAVRLPDDSEMTVRWRNLIGQRYLQVVPGASSVMLTGGETIRRTRDVVDLGQLVNQLSPLARAVSPDQLNQILTTLLEAFDGNEAAFDQLLADLDLVLATVAERDQTIAQMLDDYETVGSALATRDQQIRDMVSNLAAISSTFADNDALLDRALTELSRFSSSADQYLSASADDFGATLESFAVLLGTTADHVPELEAALANLPPLFHALWPAVDRGEWLRVSVLCVVFTPGECPYPMGFGDGLRPPGER
jgi:phospholipid/cholesterol/gamma-HCH transport system substrate-binding protein